MSTFTSFLMLSVLLVYQIGFIAMVWKKKSKFFQTMKYVNMSFILLTVFTIGTFF